MQERSASTKPSWLYYTISDTYTVKGLQKSVVFAWIVGLTFAGIFAFPSAYAAQQGYMEAVFYGFIPLIVGLGIGLVYFVTLSFRRGRR